MTKSKQRQSMHGAVLIMILTVMVVLIIMLMATLTVVTTAGQRIYTKFEENQAYYTARSALDVFANNVIYDNSYYALTDSDTNRMYSYTDTSVTPPVTKTVKMKQSLAMQLDLYKLKSQNVDGVDWGIAEEPLESDNIFGAGTPENANFTSEGINYMEYKITLPKTGNGSNQYGLLADDDVTAIIKVEVLDRVLDMGSSGYTAAQITAATATSNPSIDQIKAAIASGNRSKDFIQVKITSNMTVMGTAGSAACVYNVQIIEPPAASNAINSLGTLTGSGAGMVAAGGAATLSEDEITVDAAGTAGSLFSLGTLNWNSSGTSAFDENSSVYSVKGIKFTNSQTIIPEGADLYFYTEGAFDVTSNLTMGVKNDGTLTHPVNIICDELKYGNAININGNIYANKVVYGGSNGFQGLGANAKLHVKDLYIPNAASGKVVVDADNKITIEAGYLPTTTVYNNVYVDINGDGLYDVTETFAASKIATGATASTITFDIFKKTKVTVEDKILAQITLPVNLASGSKKTIDLPTTQSKFGQYFETDAFDEYGALVDTNKIIGAEQLFYENTNLGDGTSLKQFTTPVSGTVITTSGVLLPGNDNLVVDTNAGSVILQLKPVSEGGVNYEQDIVVTGPNHLFIVMPEGTDPTSRLTYKLGQNFNVTTNYTSEDNVTLTANEAINWQQTAPRIQYLVGNNADVELYNNNFLTGYFYMPNSELKNNAGNNGISKEYTFRDTTTTEGFFAAGSIICGNYSTGGSASGVAYIDPNGNGNNPAHKGESFLKMTPIKYSRN